MVRRDMEVTEVVDEDTMDRMSYRHEPTGKILV